MMLTEKLKKSVTKKKEHSRKNKDKYDILKKLDE